MTAADLSHTVPPATVGLAAGAAAPSSARRRALKDIAPFAIALIPFGLAAGGASAQAGLSVGQSMFGATVMLAGAAQLAAVESIGRGDGVLAVAIAVALINLRFVVYGAGVANWFVEAPRRRRFALVYPIVDQTFLLCQQRFDEETDLTWRQHYYLTATAVLATTFVGSQLVSFWLGTSLPDGVGLHLAAPLAFVGLLARALSDRRTIVAAVVAGTAIVIVSGAIGTLSLPVAVGLGVAAAMTTGGSR